MPYKKQTRGNWTQEQADENIRCLDELMGLDEWDIAFLNRLTQPQSDAVDSEQGDDDGPSVRPSIDLCHKSPSARPKTPF